MAAKAKKRENNWSRPKKKKKVAKGIKRVRQFLAIASLAIIFDKLIKSGFW